MFLAWYVYDGAGMPVWYVSSNCSASAEGTACTGPLYRTTGPAFGSTFDPTQVRLFEAGTLSVSFTDPNNASLIYTDGGVLRSKAITRQLF
jgi:hypothetical protein